MPIPSLFTPVKVPDTDTWTLYVEEPRNYPADKR